jgi:hypothetical protein
MCVKSLTDLMVNNGPTLVQIDQRCVCRGVHFERLVGYCLIRAKDLILRVVDKHGLTTALPEFGPDLSTVASALFQMCGEHNLHQRLFLELTADQK